MSFIQRRMLRRLGILQTHSVDIQRNLKVVTPDGAELLTDVYLSSAAAAPVIIMRSPYGKGMAFAGAAAYALASQGFHVVTQCCRGTFGSTGQFDPHHDEQRDGLATIEWVKRQRWYGGSIATFGMSYLGYTQWAVAAAAGPELKAMAMQVTLSDFSKMTYAGDSLALENALSWTHLVTGMQRGGFFMFRFIIARLLGLAAIGKKQWQTLPLADIDKVATGIRVGFWQDWIKHCSSADPWWRPMNFSKSISQAQRPVTMVAGWFDIFLPWQLQDFVALRGAGSESRITIGPWRHADDELIRTGLRDAIDWFNQHLLGVKSNSEQKPVKLYVNGAQEWRYFDVWPPAESISERWYLQPEHQLLDHISPESSADEYCYDPADPTPSIGGPSLGSTQFSVDNAVLESRSDVIIYTSQPLSHSRDIIGWVRAELFVSATAPTADFFVRLCDVNEQSLSRNICDGLQRVYFESNGIPQRVVVDLWPTAYRVEQGHRIRVQISSGAFPRWARNLGTLESFGQATNMRSSLQSIHHSPHYPSAIVLSFVPQDQRD